MPQEKQPKLWVLVANAAEARVLAPDAHEGRFITLFQFAPTAHLHDHREADQQRHAAYIARRLDLEAQRNAYDRLVLVATGQVLHAVRDALGKPAEQRVVGTVTHDLAKLNDHQISPHLAEWWLAPAEAA